MTERGYLRVKTLKDALMAERSGNYVRFEASEEGVEAAIKYVEHVAGFPMPEGTCICLNDEGYPIFLASKASDGETTEEGKKWVTAFLDNTKDEKYNRAGNETVKNACTGIYKKV